MLTGIPFSAPMLDRGSMSNSGILTLSEDFYRTDFEMGRSRIKATFSSIVSSGVISRLYYEIYEYEDTFADNVIEFIAVPSGMESLDVAGTKYYFTNDSLTPNVSGIFTVKAGISPFMSACNLYAALSGKSESPNSYFSANTPPHTLVSGLYADNPLYLQAVASGIDGNTLSIVPDSTSEAIVVRNKSFSKGKTFEFKDPYLEGYIACSGNLNGDYYLPDVPSSDYGLRYMVKMWFANSSGLQAVDSNWLPVIYTKVTPKIYGQTFLPFFVEVSGLTCTNLVNGGLPSDGIVYISWDDMTLYSGLHGNGLAQANAVQYTYECTRTDLAQQLVYLLIMHSSSSPPVTLPKPSGASWFPIGFTRKTNATVRFTTAASKTSVYSFWVGFGNARSFGQMSQLWPNRMVASYATMDPD